MASKTRMFDGEKVVDPGPPYSLKWLFYAFFCTPARIAKDVGSSTEYARKYLCGAVWEDCDKLIAEYPDHFEFASMADSGYGDGLGLKDRIKVLRSFEEHIYG